MSTDCTPTAAESVMVTASSSIAILAGSAVISRSASTAAGAVFMPNEVDSAFCTGSGIFSESLATSNVAHSSSAFRSSIGAWSTSSQIEFSAVYM